MSLLRAVRQLRFSILRVLFHPDRNSGPEDLSRIDIVETLMLRPAETETYHLPMRAGNVLTVNLQADCPLCVKLMDEEVWSDAGAVEDRKAAPCHWFVRSVRDTAVAFRVPATGNYMLLAWNESVVATNVILALNERRAETVVSSKGIARTEHQV